MLQSKLVDRVIEFLRSHSMEYMITGSIVSSIQGEPRATHDVDIVVSLHAQDIPSLLNAFTLPDYYLSRESIEEALQRRTMFNLIDAKEGDKIDFWILTNEPFDQSRFGRKYPETIMGQSLFISRAEDTIIAKLKWAKLSDGSEKQMQDAVRVYEVQYSNLDISYIEYWVKALKLRDYWDQVLARAQIL